MCRWDKRRLSRWVKTLFLAFAMFPVYNRTRPVVACCHGAVKSVSRTDAARRSPKHRVSPAMSPQTGGSKPGKDFESVELGGLDGSEEKQQPQREKVPRRIIHFSSGETMEEYSTDEEEDQEPEKKDLLSSPVDAVRTSVDHWLLSRDLSNPGVCGCSPSWPGVRTSGFTCGELPRPQSQVSFSTSL